MTHYLVTGGAGFIGSHLVEALVKEANTEEVCVLDNLTTGDIVNLASVKSQITFVQGDILDAKTLAKTMQGIDIVYHLAADVSVPKSVSDPLTTHEINTTGSLKVLQAAKEAGVRRVIFPSTCAVYGDEPSLPKTEISPTVPKSPYAISKLAVEGYCQTYTEHHGLETVVLRFFNVYGPRQNPSSSYAGVISLFINQLLADKTVTIFDDGEQARDFIYVSDIVAANLLVAHHPNAVNQIFNIATGQPTTINTLYQTISQIMNKNIRPHYTEPRPGDVKLSYADINLAQTQLGWQAKYSLMDGLKMTVKDCEQAK